jgi:hypothetical protein
MDSRNRNLREAPDGPALRLRQAIVAATRDGGSRLELEAAARQLVTELRGRDHPPEQVLLRIKEILSDAGLRPGHTLAADGSELMGEAALYRDVISSSIRYYFGDGDGSGPSTEE